MTDKWLFIFVSILIIFGITFSYSLPIYFTKAHGMSPYHFVLIEALVGFGGILLMWGISRLDPSKWLASIGFFLFLPVMFLMFMMYFLPSDIVPMINGAKRWILTPFFSISPVEFFKVGFVFFLSWSLTRKFYLKPERSSLVNEIKLVAPYGLIFLVAVTLIAIIQNDFGQTVVLGATLLLMLLFAGFSLRLFLLLITFSMVVAVSLILASSHRIIRIKQWWASTQEYILSFFPESIASALRLDDITMDQSYQVSQALGAIYNGGINGMGIGGGVAKLGFLSDVHTDFVLAGVAEETGLIGIFLIALLMILVIYRIFKIANRSENHVYYLFSVGIGIMISLQFLMNAMGIIGLIPLKGIAVPFISYGGSSMLALTIAIGMVLMVSKKAKL
jgi:cell division protein FtsW